MGCVSYDPAVGEIWSGIQEYLIQDCNVPFEYVLFESYESMVDALVKTKTIDVAWNGPYAHVMTELLVSSAAANDTINTNNNNTVPLEKVVSLGMRDVDRDFQSIVIGRKDCTVTSLHELKSISERGRLRLLTGTEDSPQANIVPSYYLCHELGLQFATTTHFDVDVGKHGDTAIGEIQAMEALLMNRNRNHDVDNNNNNNNNEKFVDIVILSRMMWDRALEGSYLSDYNINPDQLRDTCEEMTFITIPPFDHCQFDAIVLDNSDDDDDDDDDDNNHNNKTKLSLLNKFGTALLGMSWDNPKQQRLMKLEGIQKEWKYPRQDGYDIVRKAVFARNARTTMSTDAATAAAALLVDHKVATNFDYQQE
jgi:ABC-type phosphate/phosphonate transport system substrate-binding protein